jgi:YVTN family beta-propeller protein
MGEKLEEAGYPDMSSAVRPMAIDEANDIAYFQVSFHHGFVEFDLAAGEVLRVADLPIADHVKDMPREQYLLDSAHHGLALNPDRTKLCAAGTMSDYAAIVDRETFDHTIVDVGPKPYWSTNGPDGDVCWVSVSGSDEVVVIDYATEAEVARIPVGDHPQRVRAGVVADELLPGAASPPGEVAVDAEATAAPDVGEMPSTGAPAAAVLAGLAALAVTATGRRGRPRRG